MCVCVRVCVCVREREREREWTLITGQLNCFVLLSEKTLLVPKNERNDFKMNEDEAFL